MPATTYWDAMRVTSKAEADQIIDELVARALSEAPELTPDEARRIQLSNIGYHFGYLTPEERARVMPLYPQAEHPIYGRFNKDYSVEDSLAAGVALGKAMQEGKTHTEAILEARKALKDNDPPSHN